MLEANGDINLSNTINNEAHRFTLFKKEEVKTLDELAGLEGVTGSKVFTDQKIVEEVKDNHSNSHKKSHHSRSQSSYIFCRASSSELIANELSRINTIASKKFKAS